MDAIFWIGLGLGALVSIPAAVIANLWTDPVRGFMDRRRTVKLGRKKEKELRKYWLVRAIMEGDEAEKANFIFRQNFAIHSAIFSVGYIIAALCAGVAIYGGGFTSVLKNRWFILLSVVWGFGANYLLLFSFGTMLQAWRITMRLRDFARYERSIVEKWGNPEPEAPI
jgi:hypothetical protein